ncbi:MAG: hypothetical protein MUC43_19435 [Pirellula sp.]|jgi:hypothetical protein|nr:hypothetical protein [Pirellula sp.]
MAVRSINIEHEIPSPLTYAVEVTIELDSGERRWCFFCTPESLDRFGDFLPNSTIRIHAAAPHMIVLSIVTQETITAAINELQRNGELQYATRPMSGTRTSRQCVWVFNGVKASFPSGVFTSRENAEAWIKEHNLEGTLTLYPVDQSAYDNAIANGWFNPKLPHQKLPEFIQRFTSASQEHYHYERQEKK